MLPPLLLLLSLQAPLPVAPCLPFDPIQNPRTGSEPPAMGSDEEARSSPDAIRHARATTPPASPAPLPPPPTIHRVPAALAVAEQARYRVTYGVLPVGEATVTVDGAATVRDRAPLHARGHAAGSFVGFGQFDHAIDVAFDPIALVPVAPAPGAVTPQGRPLLWHRLMSRFPAPTLPVGPNVTTFDPVSLLLRLRAEPPAPGASLVATVFDGKARWRVTLINRGPAVVGMTPAVKLEGRAEPISAGRTAGTRASRAPSRSG